MVADRDSPLEQVLSLWCAATGSKLHTVLTAHNDIYSVLEAAHLLFAGCAHLEIVQAGDGVTFVTHYMFEQAPRYVFHSSVLNKRLTDIVIDMQWDGGEQCN